MPVGPPGWTHQMCQEHECEFVLMAWALASAEAGFVAWVGPKVFRGGEGSASVSPHLLLVLPGGGFWGGGGGESGGGVGFGLWWGGGGSGGGGRWERGGWGGVCLWLGEGRGMIEG